MILGCTAERERLEQERKELEKIKAEAAERKRIEEERLRIEAEKKQILAIPRPDTPSSLSGSGEKEIASDGTLLAYASGVVYDKNTGLEWFAGPDRDTTWNEAKAWVESLNVAGGGWRMPTREELKTLYQKGAGTRNMTPLLKTTGWCGVVWRDTGFVVGLGLLLQQRRRGLVLPRLLRQHTGFCGAFPKTMMDYWVI